MSLDSKRKRIEEFFKNRKVTLPSPPALAVRLLEGVKKEDYKKLAELIRLDPALSARVLAIANSPLYRGERGEITSIETAIALLGTDLIKNIALSFILARDFKPRGFKEMAFDFERFWKRAVSQAVAARLLAQVVNEKEDHLFTSALLMDTGVIVFYLLLGEDYLRVFDEKEVSERPLCDIEEEFYGFSHADIGAYLFEKWKLPDHIVEDIRYHHHWEKAPKEYRTHAQLLYYSDLLGGIYFSYHSAEKYQSALDEIPKRLNLSEEEVKEIIDRVAIECRDIFAFFDLPQEQIPPYSEILEESKAELEKLSISYALLLRQLKEEKKRVEELARRLKAANEKLRKLSILDGLTELYNHRYFQERLHEEFERARRYKRNLSVIMIDIDHFKKINDTYGHLFGDFVLRELARIIKENLRKSDIAARYGGEEFAIILPETEIQGATTLGERLRRKVEEHTFQMDGISVKVTISLGVASIFPARTKKTPRDLLETADKALYYSKTHGRNRLTAVNITD